MRYLTFKDLRVMLGNRGRTTIYRDIKAGRLPPPFKLGSRLYWKEHTVEEYLQEASDAE